MDFEKMKREEEEAVELMYGTPTADESPADAVPINDDDFEEVPVSTETTEQVVEEYTPEPVQTKKESAPRVSWKKRYANFKASTDSTIFELRKEVAKWKAEYAASQEAIQAIHSEVAELKSQLNADKDPFEGAVTKEQIDLIGEDAVDIMKNIAKANKSDDTEVKLLKQKLAKMEQERLDALKRESQSLEEESLNELKAKLTTLVPDWSTIDTEEGFAEYVQGIDEVSGQPRMRFFQTAIADRNISAVAGFYNAYKSLKPRSKQEVLAERVTPTGTGSAQPSTGPDDPKRVYSIGEYMEFMDSVAKGDYRRTPAKRKEAQLLERQWDLRLSQGRVK